MIDDISKLIKGTRWIAAKLMEHQSLYGSDQTEDDAIAETLRLAAKIEEQIKSPTKLSEHLCQYKKEC